MINVDISNVWGDISLPDLLSIEQEIGAAHMMLTEGTGAGAEYRGWLKLPAETSAHDIRRIQEAAWTIRDQSEVCVVVGIGGSYLGPRAAIELLQGPNRNLRRTKGDPVILYAGNNLSTRAFQELTRLDRLLPA